jgi:hypothetical protein
MGFETMGLDRGGREVWPASGYHVFHHGMGRCSEERTRRVLGRKDLILKRQWLFLALRQATAPRDWNSKNYLPNSFTVLKVIAEEIDKIAKF